MSNLKLVQNNPREEKEEVKSSPFRLVQQKPDPMTAMLELMIINWLGFISLMLPRNK